MATIKAKLSMVPMVGYYCGKCGYLIARDELKEGMNLSKRKLNVHHYYDGRCPRCGVAAMQVLVRILRKFYVVFCPQCRKPARYVRKSACYG